MGENSRGACQSLQEDCGSKSRPVDEPNEWGCVCVCVCMCVRERDIHTCGIMGCVELLTKVVSVLPGGPECGLMADCGLRGMVGVP